MDPTRVAEGTSTSMMYNDDVLASVVVAYMVPSVGSSAIPLHTSVPCGLSVPSGVWVPESVSIFMN
jgi:hypothetical protein